MEKGIEQQRVEFVELFYVNGRSVKNDYRKLGNTYSLCKSTNY